MASLRLTCCVVLLLATAPAHARAEPPALRDPDDADLALRLAWLERVLDREADATRTWRASWLGFYGAAVLFEGALLATAGTPAARVNAGVTLGKASVAFGFLLVNPATGAHAARIVHGRPDGTRAERIARLRLAESFLEGIAAEERSLRGWFTLAGGAALNTAGAWISWGSHRGTAGLGWLGVASGLLVSQIQFHTQPTGAIRAWDAYRRAGAGARLGEPPAVLRWSIGPTAGGMALQGAF